MDTMGVVTKSISLISFQLQTMTNSSTFHLTYMKFIWAKWKVSCTMVWGEWEIPCILKFLAHSTTQDMKWMMYKVKRIVVDWHFDSIRNIMRKMQSIENIPFGAFAVRQHILPTTKTLPRLHFICSWWCVLRLNVNSIVSQNHQLSSYEISLVLMHLHLQHLPSATSSQRDPRGRVGKELCLMYFQEPTAPKEVLNISRELLTLPFNVSQGNPLERPHLQAL